ncbi:MAG TPA: hypothetical protein VEB22_08550, partial [Phycisphaerales bacterium]|nr:hypothetical protein [Phycisphaerales bacterium]
MKHLVLFVAPLALTPCLIAEPGKAPVDSEGNRARPAFTPVLFESTSEGASFVPAWAPFGPKGANARAVAASPTAANVRIAGVNDSFGQGGLYVSNDNGGFWQLVNETGNRGIKDVEFTLSGKAFAATQDGLFASTDNGATWQRVTLPGVPEPVLIEALAADPSNGQVVWVGLGQFLNGTSTQLVLKSTDGGASWNDVSPAVTGGMGA